MNIDPAWTSDGLRSLHRLGLKPADVIDVMYDKTSIFIQIEQTKALFIVGMTDDDNHIITVICDVQARNTTIYGITWVRESTLDEIAHGGASNEQDNHHRRHA